MKIKYKYTQCDICSKERTIENRNCIVISNKFNICHEHIKIIKDHLDNFKGHLINEKQLDERLNLL